MNFAATLEKQILGACLRERQAIERAHDVIDTECFLIPAHKTLWEALLRLPADLIWDFKQIGLELLSRGILNQIGGPVGMLDIHDSVITAANVTLHARQLKEICYRREIAVISEKIKKSATNATALAELHSELSSIEKKITLLRDSEKPSPAYEVAELIEATISGQRQAVPLPWRTLNTLTQALLPGTVTLVIGIAGSRKSFSVLQMYSHFLKNGVLSSLYELEENRQYHLLRALAQESGIADLTKAAWVSQNPELAREAYTDYAEFLQKMGALIEDCPEQQMTLSAIASWVERKARNGCRVITVDPVSVAAYTRRDTWNEDSEFIQRVKQAAVKYQCSVVLVLHPAKNVSLPDMGQIAGGAAYSRFSQTIIWWESHESKESSVRTMLGTADIEHDMTCYVLKSRNGSGSGCRIAFSFQNENLCLKEQGLITKRCKHGN
jgi:replicative DNA helicase